MFPLSTLSKTCSVLLIFMTVVVAQYPTPIRFTGHAAANPPKALDYQDIRIIRRVSDGTYFRFAKSNSTGLGLSVATSPTFRGPWIYSYAALPGPLKDPIAVNRSEVRLWAPEVHLVNTTYYLYYTINHPHAEKARFDIAVATSTDLTDGSWTDHGSVRVPSAFHENLPKGDYVRLGVNLLTNDTDPDGIDPEYSHLTFGSFGHGLYGVFLADDLLTVAPNAVVTEILADQYNPAVTQKLQGNKTEGSYQLHYADYIYYFYSIGSCCASGEDAGPESVYRVEVCRGNYTDGPNGPFFDRDGIDCLTGSVNRTGTVVVASHGDSGSGYEVFAPGSIGIARDEVEGLVMYYQYKNLSASDRSLRFGFNYLGFDDDDWPVLLAEKSTA